MIGMNTLNYSLKEKDLQKLCGVEIWLVKKKLKKQMQLHLDVYHLNKINSKILAQFVESQRNIWFMQQDNTKNIIIEAAIFDSIKIRKTSKKILRSEASNRFEKGIDPKRTYMAMMRSCALLQK